MIKTINGFLDDDESGEKSLDLLNLADKMERTTGSGFKKYKKNLESEKTRDISFLEVSILTASTSPRWVKISSALLSENSITLRIK